MTQDLYSQLIEAIQNSPFNKFLAEKDLEKIKKIYKNADANTLKKALLKINKEQDKLEKLLSKNNKKIAKNEEKIDKIITKAQKNKIKNIRDNEASSKENDKKILKALEANL